MTPRDHPRQLGPVSALLEAELRESLTRHGLVIWLDADNHYHDFIQQLIDLRQQEQLPYQVFTFRGSFLELMLQLEDVTSGIDTTRAVIHLPGFHEETVKSTPLLELYRAGKRFRKALETLVRDAAAGKVRPDQIDAFLRRGDLTLTAADQWLQDLVTRGTEGLAGSLCDVGLTELVDALLMDHALARQIVAAWENGHAADRQALCDRIVALTGMPETWLEDRLHSSFSADSSRQSSAEPLAHAVASWAMCVSFVHDLAIEPRSPLLLPVLQLPTQVREQCHQLVLHLQNGSDRQRTFYRQTALETESLLSEEDRAVSAYDLGHFDTFPFEEESLLKATLLALEHAKWQDADEWARDRARPDAYWLRDAPLRRGAWQLVAAATRLGLALEAAGPELTATDSLHSAVEQYVQAGAPVDRAHRHLLQLRQKLLQPRIAEFESLRGCLDRMQRLWQHWADAWARRFNAVCSHHGFLPESSRQQRALFDDVVRPLAAGHDKVAYFVIDALRYEMGEELLEAMEDTPHTTAKLNWRLAELPTVTEVGMNVLAPVAKQGRLAPVVSEGRISGFSTGSFRVFDPKTRQRAIHDRIGGATCPMLSLSEILERDAKTLKATMTRCRLIVVHSRELDRAGEAGSGPGLFDDIMQDIRSAWHLLREAGCRQFVFTSDHGFLLADESAQAVHTHGRKVDPHRRHVISDRPANHAGEVRVPFRDLGYDGDDLHLMFPDSVGVFDTGQKPKGFLHGGNSPQERVIPMLTVSHRISTGTSLAEYRLTARKREAIAGMHCISVRVAAAESTLDYLSSFEVELALRVSEVPGVRVDLCDLRGAARLAAGTVVARVSEEFELFFRLSGATTARVQVELYHPSKEALVPTLVLKERFEVTPVAMGSAGPPTTVLPTERWLEDLPEGPVRRVFQHLAQHGLITESEATTMLGNAREVRKFSRHFESYAASAPFPIRIDAVSGVKRYVREGNS